MLPTPLFSVLIANYNNGIYLEEALQSVLAQTYTNWEIILVDDASTDNSKEIYKKYSSDTRIHIYYNDKNYGCGYTKHRCVELAKGEICGFLDPDDALAETALEESMHEHIKRPDFSLIYSGCYVCNKNLIPINKSNAHKIPEGKSYLDYGHWAIFHFATFKKKIYDKTEGINIEFKRAIDQDLYLKLEEVGKIEFISSQLYYYRTNTGNNISLGENNKTATLWHITALIDACRRRHLAIEDIVLRYYEEFIRIFNNKEMIQKTKELNDVYASFPFKLGKLLTAPFRCIKRIITHNKS